MLGPPLDSAYQESRVHTRKPKQAGKELVASASAKQQTRPSAGDGTARSLAPIRGGPHPLGQDSLSFTTNLRRSRMLTWMCMLDYDPTCASRSLYPLTQVKWSQGDLVIWRTRGHVTPEGVPPVLPAGVGRGLRFLRSDCMTLTPCLFSRPVPAPATHRQDLEVPVQGRLSPQHGVGGCLLRGEARDPGRGPHGLRSPRPAPESPSCADGVRPSRVFRRPSS